MEYISIFRCKTKSVIWGFFTKLLADHIRKLEGTHTFPFTHPGVLGHLLESQKAKRAFTTLGRSCLFDHWFGEKQSLKVQFSLEHRWLPDHSFPPLLPPTRRTANGGRTCYPSAWTWRMEGGGGPSGAVAWGEYTMNHRNSECLRHQSVNAQQSRSNQWPATDVYYSATLDTVRLIILLEHKNSFRKYKNLKHCPHVFYKNKMNNFLTLK